MTDSLAVVIRPMQECDLDAVIALEKRCFPTPWSRDMYAHEITANPYGSYWVLVPAQTVADMQPENRAVVHIPPGKIDSAEPPPLLAYGGLWLIADEAHITTLASHPDWRRQGIAGRLLIYLLDLARESGAKSATLEARMTNAAAIGLYEKLGFVEVGVRKRYYADTGEDARLLTLFNLDSPVVWARLVEEQRKFEAQPED